MRAGNGKPVGRLDGKTAVITGGASGIGEGSVRAFVAEGANVVIADLRLDAAQALAEELGDAAIGVAADVSAEADVAAAVDAAVEHFGRLDCMFNNAGIVGAVGPIAEMDVADFDRTIAVLLRGPFLGIKHAARVMGPQGSGSIITTASTAGLAGGLGPHGYTTAKHGVVGLTRSAASELADDGIRVNAIAPGNIVTNMTARLGPGDADFEQAKTAIAKSSPLGIAGEPSDIAFAAVYLASDESRYMSGETILIDSGFLAGAGRKGGFHRGGSAMITGIAGT
ncbi:MAG: glucose 1-dehydrogenase [Acidimicrobiia bacterium]|nr:glucose 1-dehydrogenase [Acidimicrobiia bacterium]